MAFAAGHQLGGYLPRSAAAVGHHGDFPVGGQSIEAHRPAMAAGQPHIVHVDARPGAEVLHRADAGITCTRSRPKWAISRVPMP